MSSPVEQACPACHCGVAPGSSFCTRCGTPQPQVTVIAPGVAGGQQWGGGRGRERGGSVPGSGGYQQAGYGVGTRVAPGVGPGGPSGVSAGRGQVRPSHHPALGPAFDGVVPAGVGRRIGSFMLDLLVLAVVATLVFWWTESVVYTVIVAIEFGIGLVVWDARSGATFGNAVFGLRTAKVESPYAPGLGRAVIRALFLGVGNVIPFLGVLSCAFDSSGRGQAWHDKAARTVVVDVRGLRTEVATAAEVRPPMLVEAGQIAPVPRPERPAPLQAPPPPPAAPSLPAPPAVPLAIGIPAYRAQAAPPPPPAVPALDAVHIPPVVSAPRQAAVAPPAPPQVGTPATPPAVVPPVVPGVRKAMPPVPRVASAPVPPRAATQAPGVRALPLGPPAPAPAAPVAPRLTRPNAPASFVMTLDTGQATTVSGSGYIGRRPQIAAGERCDHVIEIEDPTRSLSRTHARFGIDQTGFWIEDCGSANGTVVRGPDGSTVEVGPGRRLVVPSGAVVCIGQRTFTVRPAQ